MILELVVGLSLIAGAAMILLVIRMVYFRSRLPNNQLWVIGTGAYDLRGFIDKHPGGHYILEATQGRDCTALFHSYHAMSSRDSWIQKTLQTYWVRLATPDEITDNAIWNWEETPFYTELRTEMKKAVGGGGRAAFKASWAHLGQYTLCMAVWLVSIKSWLCGSWTGGVVAGLGIWYVSGDILHAATHYAVFSDPKANLLVGWVVGWLHHVPSMWIRQHVLTHHVYTNIQGRDPDLDHFRQFSKLKTGWRLSSLQNMRPAYHNWRLGLLPVAAMTGIGPLLGESIQALITGSYMRSTKMKYVQNEMILTVLQLVMVGALGLLLPYVLNRSFCHMLLPYSIHGFLYYSFAAVSHTNEASASKVQRDGQPVQSSAETDTSKAREWAQHQVETSQGDYAPTSQVWGLVSLGLNNQAIHHVFPAIHPCHYYLLAPVMKRVCEKHKVKYHTHPTFWDAICDHISHLRRLNDPVKQKVTVAAGVLGVSIALRT